MMIQFPTAIFMVSRLNNEYRVIFTDGRERIPEGKLDRNWGGESLGHWEGDTLVVETTGFTDDNHLIQAGVITGDQLKIVERIQMINDGNTLVTEFTFHRSGTLGWRMEARQIPRSRIALGYSRGQLHLQRQFLIARNG